MTWQARPRQMAALGVDGQHAGVFAMGIQVNVRPVPASRKVHGGVTGAGEIVGDEQASNTPHIMVPGKQPALVHWVTMRPADTAG